MDGYPHLHNEGDEFPDIDVYLLGIYGWFMVLVLVEATGDGKTAECKVVHEQPPHAVEMGRPSSQPFVGRVCQHERCRFSHYEEAY